MILARKELNNMEMLFIKMYGLPKFYIGHWMNTDLACFYVIQYFPKSYVINATGTRTVFVRDSVMLLENIYRRDRGLKI